MVYVLRLLIKFLSIDSMCKIHYGWLDELTPCRLFSLFLSVFDCVNMQIFFVFWYVLFSVIKLASNSSRLLLLLWNCLHYTCFPLTASYTPVHLSPLSWLHWKTWLWHTGQLIVVQGSHEENNTENILTTWAVPYILVTSAYHYVTSIIHIISLVIVV